MPTYRLLGPDNNITSDDLRKLDTPHENHSHSLIVVTDATQMRGLDFRAPSKGVCLVINKTFNSFREAAQGLSRVGRYGDPGRTEILPKVALVDSQQQNS